MEMPPRIERLKDRLTDHIANLTQLKEIHAHPEIIENKFIDFIITSDAFIEEMGCRAESNVMEGDVLIKRKISCGDENGK